MKEVQPEGNFYDKYSSKNLIERKLLTGFFETVKRVLCETMDVDSITSVYEAGCGEGHFTEFLGECFPKASLNVSDVSENCIMQAKETLKELKVSFSVQDISELTDEADKGASFELVAASEVLEHIEEPQKALKAMEAVTSKYVLITVPNEPIWRILNMCRLKYLKRFGNTPGHINHWGKRSFIRFVRENSGLKVVSAAKSLPWLIFVLEKGN